MKKKRPAYKEILSFYQKVREEQEKSKSSMKIKPIPLKKEWKDLLTKEGFSLLEKKDFPIDLEASAALFRSLCEIGKGTTPRMTDETEKIGELLHHKKMDLKKAFTEEAKIDYFADKFGLDKKVFGFLIRESLRPSIEAVAEKLLGEIDSQTWLKGVCPVCASLPYLSLLKETEGKKFLICSFCGHLWRSERIFCPFCGNKEQPLLNYFYAEGEESYRIDTCDQCHQYIKTVDARNIEILDPALEDLATLHLDLLATQKGYKRPVPTPWTP